MPKFYLSLTIDAEQDEDGVLIAEVHPIKGCYTQDGVETGTASQGFTVEEAIANLREAAELYLEEFPLKK
ncbi:MAG: type II toxin-antitoxin system HicB family antitoxin [Candidatus Aenigmarchaeota archaeon]|nr:type II toxin-antitoxin system HicB family antitoxin [Candidatus Aenigmarchaeota archaeon]